MKVSNGFHFSSAALVAVVASVAAFHWTDIVDAKTASEIVVGLGIAKSILALFDSDQPNNDKPA